MGGRGRSAVHRHGLLRRRWSVPKAQRTEGAASAWESGGGVVCSDRHGSAGTVQTPSIPFAPRWQAEGRWILGKCFMKKKCILKKKSIYEVDPVPLAIAFECFWTNDVYVEVDVDFGLRGMPVLYSLNIYSKINFKGPESTKSKEWPFLLPAGQLCHTARWLG